MTLFKWSQIAANNGNADSTCPFPEGMNPAAVNDGARGMMAAAAKYRDDMAGAIVTGGTSTAYTVSSFQGFDTLAHLDGKEIAFTPHATNGANGTSLNVDGLGVKPLLPSPGVGLPGGVLVQGTPYVALYNNTDGAFYLKGYFNSPYSIPLGGGLDFWGDTAPNSSFAFPIGQAISRTTYAGLFALFGTKYGNGDGATTFNLPDKTGRVSAMIEAAATRLTSNYFGGDSTKLGAVGGLEKHLLLETQLAPHYHGAGMNDPGHSHTYQHYAGGLRNDGTSALTVHPDLATGTTSTSFTGVRIQSANGLDTTDTRGGGQAHNNVQPTICCNYIIRIL